MNSEDINTAVNISIIHIHLKALQHNKAVPISHLNSLQYFALYYVDQMPFWMGHNTEEIICLWVSIELQGIMGLEVILSCQSKEISYESVLQRLKEMRTSYMPNT